MFGGPQGNSLNPSQTDVCKKTKLSGGEKVAMSHSLLSGPYRKGSCRWLSGGGEEKPVTLNWELSENFLQPDYSHSLWLVPEIYISKTKKKKIPPKFGDQEVRLLPNKVLRERPWYACMHLCMYVCVHICIHVCMHVCVDMCMCACMHAYECMHVCISPLANT